MASSPNSRFCFLVHPRTLDDVFAFFKIPKAFTRPFLRSDFLDRILSRLPLQRVGVVLERRSNKGRGRSIVIGTIDALPFTVRYLTSLRYRSQALSRIQRTIDQLASQGVGVVGLGALLTSVTQLGKTIHPPKRCRIATGRLLTTYNMVRLLENSFEKLVGEAPTPFPLAIIGAGGSIGSGSAIFLAARGWRKFFLVDLPEKRSVLEEVATIMHEHNPEVDVTIVHDTAAAVQQSVGILTATSRPDAVIREEDVLPGTLIIDDAQPSDVDPSLCWREDVAVLAGGAMYAPHIVVEGATTLFGLASHHIFSCMAETYLFTKFPGTARRFQPARLPRWVTPDLIASVGALAEKVNILPGIPHNPSRIYTDEDWQNMRRALLSRQNRFQGMSVCGGK